MVIDVRKVSEDACGLAVYIPVNAATNLGMDALNAGDNKWEEAIPIMLRLIHNGSGPKKDDVLLLSPTADMVIVVDKSILRMRVN